MESTQFDKLILMLYPADDKVEGSGIGLYIEL